jgi:PIN domain
MAIIHPENKYDQSFTSIPMNSSIEQQQIRTDYAALTLDTCIFDQYGLELDKGLLKRLDQFQGDSFDLIMCDIVHSEIDKHLKQKARETQAQISKALKAANPHLGIGEANILEVQKLLSSPAVDEISKIRLENFIAATGTQIINAAEYVNVADLTDLYFSDEPPFEASGSKKNEFPDAIALLTLEAWAKRENKKILAVSTDRGWKDFAEKSDWIDVKDDLGKCIEAFQVKNAPSFVARALRLDLLNSTQSKYQIAIANAIAESMHGAGIEVEAQSSYYFESDDAYADYVTHDILNDACGKLKVSLVEGQDQCVVVSISCEVHCKVHASFELQAWDSIDKEYIAMGSIDSSQSEWYHTDVLITLVGNVIEGLDAMEIDEIEVLETISHADFGQIEPDWS